jgi:hypothetical protein
MSDGQRDAGRLQADLAQLRAALRTVEAPPVDEAALRAQFRAAVQQREQAAATAAHTAGSWRMHIAAAAVVVLAIAAVFAAVLLRVERPKDAPLVADAPSMPPLAASAFQPLLNAPGLSPSLSYSVVRVRIPLSAFALVPGTQENGTIEADLLVGEDGLARGIRFAAADTMLVSVAAQ